MGVIAVGARTGVVEKVAFGLDGCARELWVRLGDEVRRVPASAVAVTGYRGERTVDAGEFARAPRA